MDEALVNQNGSQAENQQAKEPFTHDISLKVQEFSIAGFFAGGRVSG
jgi:hypothetical protein